MNVIVLVEGICVCICENSRQPGGWHGIKEEIDVVE